MVTGQPDSARERAMARPIPRAPPVITATRSPTLRSPRRADALRAGGYMGL